MSTLLQFLIIFLLIFFVIPHIEAISTTTTCGEMTCSSSIPRIRFPFRIKNVQPSSCGYEGFDVTCSARYPWQAMLTLPSSGAFIVQHISYIGQHVWIADPDKCFPKWFMDNNFSLIGSPFLYMLALENFTFLNCSSESDLAYMHPPISCLSNDQYLVIGVPSKWINSTSEELSSYNCSVISTVMVPFTDPYEWDSLNMSGFELAWFVPDCHFCEASGKVCGSENGTSSKLTCSRTDPGYPNNIDDFPGFGKYGVLICMGIGGIFIIVTAIVLRLKICGQVDQPILELSAITNPQPPIVIIGLDERTIESYPKTQLGQSWDLPNPNDSTCPICLCEYKAKEILRTIPECNHYFHANCIDKWLRRNATCPFCRNPSEGNKVMEA